LKFVAQEMGLEEEWVQLLNELKLAAKTDVQDFPGQYMNFQLKCTLQVRALNS
jgi:hypothetical protein